jgi:UDP-2-acetamido-3-amino-2,3-dideoxy-glucuronate N-acetyltransferase
MDTVSVLPLDSRYNVRIPVESVTQQLAPGESGAVATTVAGVMLHRLPHFRDFRGLLSVAETDHQVPFEIKRFFLVSGVARTDIRGEHAHHSLWQFLVCVHGSCELIADDGHNRQSFLLDEPSVAVLLPPMVWGVQHRFTPDAVLLVLASEKYDPSDYIRDYDSFLKLVKAPR